MHSSSSAGVAPALRCLGLQALQGRQQILKDISLELQSGEMGLLLGPVGAGKSSLMHALCGLLPCSWELLQKKEIALSPQEPMLWSHLTVNEHLQLVSSPNTAEKTLERFALHELQRRLPHQLSGGQKRMLSIARALACPAPIVFLDEFSAGLGYEQSSLVMEELSREIKRGRSILVSGHSFDPFLGMITKIGVISGGQLLQWDCTDILISRPEHPAVTQMMGLGDLLRGEYRIGGIQTAAGWIQASHQRPTGASALVLVRRGEAHCQLSHSTTADQPAYKVVAVHHETISTSQKEVRIRLPTDELLSAISVSKEGIRVTDRVFLSLDVTDPIIFDN